MNCNSIARLGAGRGALALLAALTVGCSLARVGDARAEQQAARYAKRLFAGKVAAKGKSYACFARRYGAAHLAKHPAQKVTVIRLLVSAAMLPEDKALNYSFSFAVKFRDRPGDFNSSGSCGHPAASQESPDKLALSCGVDCDGGGVGLELADAGKSILLSVESVAIWDNGKPDAERTSLEGGADDRLFRLDRVKLEQCKPLMGDDDKDAEKPATM
jgi:hypothetical protein